MVAPTIGHLQGSPSNKDREDFEDLLRRAASSVRAPEKPAAKPFMKVARSLTYRVTRLLRARA